MDSRPTAADGSAGGRATAAAVEAWLAAVVARHTAAFSRPEFLKATRALSARYVEGRAALPTRSVMDSAGKRAAFAGYYAPLHFLIARAVLTALAPRDTPSAILDLGSGTGAAGLAWATLLSAPVAITGVDTSAWALDEMRWNAHALSLSCRTRRADMTTALRPLARPAGRQAASAPAITCGWSLNELPAAIRGSVCADLIAAAAHGASVLVLEPMARSAVPWWSEWQRQVEAAGGRCDEWRLPLDLPTSLADMDRDVGFRRDHLGVRSTFFPSAPQGGAPVRP